MKVLCFIRSVELTKGWSNRGSTIDIRGRIARAESVLAHPLNTTQYKDGGSRFLQNHTRLNSITFQKTVILIFTAAITWILTGSCYLFPPDECMIMPWNRPQHPSCKSPYSYYSWHHSTPWSESASELYRPSNRRMSAKWLPTFADKGCHVVSVTDPYGRILGFLDRSRYFSIK
jgi:hypothetical protein